MGKIDAKKHEEMRKWAASEGFGDPEKLIIRNGENILYKSKDAIVKYRRLEQMYDAGANEIKARELKHENRSNQG